MPQSSLHSSIDHSVHLLGRNILVECSVDPTVFSSCLPYGENCEVHKQLQNDSINIRMHIYKIELSNISTFHYVHNMLWVNSELTAKYEEAVSQYPKYVLNNSSRSRQTIIEKPHLDSVVLLRVGLHHMLRQRNCVISQESTRQNHIGLWQLPFSGIFSAP